MEHSERPSLDLAKTTLPLPLFEAIERIFSTYSEGCCLVGGTALAGFYAGHRRSDDLDLFTRDDFSQQATIAAVVSLTNWGVTISGQRESPQHFRCLAEDRGHRFTIDVVLDSHFHAFSIFQTQIENIRIATLRGLLAMKIATLVSRCSEKDLYDLMWLFKHYQKPSFSEFASVGKQIDAGVSDESILISLSGSTLQESACHFAEPMGVDASTVLENIEHFKMELIHDYSAYLKNTDQNLPLKVVLDKLRGPKR